MTIFFREEREWSRSDVARLVRSHECLAMLSQGEALQLVEHMRPQTVRTGTVLFQEGQKKANFMALILEGEATVETLGGGHGAPVMLKVLQEGDLIGEQGILDDASRSATVTAASDMALATMSQTQFNRLHRETPALSGKMMLSILRTVTRRLAESNRKLHILTQLNKTLQDELEARVLEMRQMRKAG